MKIGYARVSTEAQSLNLQRDALAQFGCEEIFEEKVSGAKANRPVFKSLLNYVRKGDTVVVWKLDRLGRSLIDLIKTANFLKEKEVDLVSIQDSINTTTPGGKLIFHLMAALAEFELDMISERTKAGLKAARARGRFGGRPPGPSDRIKKLAPIIVTLYKAGKMTNKEICEHLKISPGTIYNCLKRHKEKINNST